MQHISSEDTEIFAELLKSMEDNIKPTIDNLTWSVPPSVAKSALKTISDQTKVVCKLRFLKLKVIKCNICVFHLMQYLILMIYLN